MSISCHAALQYLYLELFDFMTGSYTYMFMLRYPDLQSMDFESFYGMGITLTCPCHLTLFYSP